MPWRYREIIQFGILLLCVPLQYYLTNSLNLDESASHVLKIVKDLQNFKNSFFQISIKQQWLKFLSWFVINVLDIRENESDESPALEVFQFRKKLGLLQKSEKIHFDHPKEVLYKVGQVVEHITDGYKGVIVDWFFDNEVTKIPVYYLLLHQIDTNLVLPVKEVSQNQIYLLDKAKIVNTHLRNYFSLHDGTKYIPRPWLRKLYHKD
uniref:Hemimethylated DNA-binding domain-containing protein n=1 Tax=Clastoptera arizonana TaxID=38151 RepID=A0A1B6EFU6_9HEMI